MGPMARENIRAWTLVLLAWQLVGTASSLGAEPSDQARSEARAHFRNGARLIRLGAYAAAVEEFSEAYRLYPNERIHYDLAQAYRLENDIPHAVAHYRRYLAAVHDGELAADARQQLSALGATVDQAAATESSLELQASAAPARLPSSASGGDTAVEQPAPPPSPLQPSVPTAPVPQPSLLAPALTTRPAASDVLVKKPDEAPPTRRTPAYKKWWPWTIGGLAIIGAAVGLGLALTPHPPAPTIGKVTL